MRTRTLERALLVVLVLITLALAWTYQGQRRRLEDQGQRLAEIEVRLKVIGDAAKLRGASVPSTDMFQPPRGASSGQGARGGAVDGAKARPGPGAAARGRTPPVPGANVLDRLYEAADELAASEQWDDPTYEAVAQVFDDTTTAMLDLWKDVQAGKVSITQARRQAVEVRESAQARLQAVLGDDGAEKLRARIKEDFAELMPAR